MLSSWIGDVQPKIQQWIARYPSIFYTLLKSLDRSVLRATCLQSLHKGDGSSMGPWTDTYLLGAMLYEILEGRAPRRGTTLGDVIQQACLGDTDPFEKCTSPTLQQICLRALAPSPNDHYQHRYIRRLTCVDISKRNKANLY